jgi:hypothetical protein
MGKFRKQYDQLRLRMQRRQTSGWRHPNDRRMDALKEEVVARMAQEGGD